MAQREPRLAKAMGWIQEFVPPEDRTLVRSEPDLERLGRLTESEAGWVGIFLERLGEADELDLDHVTALVYGVPKVALGMDISGDPTDEVKADQKSFFRLLYQLLVGADRGPRLPTLIVALGGAKVRSLLTAG